MRLKRTTIGLVALAVCGAAHADLGNQRTVDRITDASAIAAYEFLDPIHMLLTVDPERHYRLTFDAPCNQARFAERIGISRTDDEIHAGWDYVLAGGLRCRIDTIEKL